MNQLKDAEKTASQMVAFARKEQSHRMVEAKLDAEKTISAYRDELEAKYSAAHTAITGNASSTSSDLDAQVVTDISSMQSEFTLRQAAMEDALVDLVCKVEVKPRPARGK